MAGHSPTVRRRRLAAELRRLRGERDLTIDAVAQQLGWRVPDWVIIPGGNLGNVSALGAGFELLLALGLIDRRPRICVAQAAHASPLYASYRAVPNRAGRRAVPGS